MKNQQIPAVKDMLLIGTVVYGTKAYEPTVKTQPTKIGLDHSVGATDIRLIVANFHTVEAFTYKEPVDSWDIGARTVEVGYTVYDMGYATLPSTAIRENPETKESMLCFAKVVLVSGIRDYRRTIEVYYEAE